MEKQFKLIKKYPGSPTLGTIVNYSEKHGVYNYNGGDYYSELPKHQVENLPEYWQEITKDWEILEFKDEKGKIGCLEDNGRYNFLGPGHEDTAFSLESMLDDTSLPNVSINKVKRISDGEVFEVWDDVRPNLPFHDFLISRFDIVDGEMLAYSLFGKGFSISNIDKVPKNWAHEKCGFTRDFYDLQDALNSKYINTGWQCPKCKTIWNPDTEKCKYCLTDK